MVSRGSRVRDYQTKREEYHAFGVRESWIVDPALRQVVVLDRRDDDWDEQIVRTDDVIPSRILPGLDARVGELWAGVNTDDA